MLRSLRVGLRRLTAASSTKQSGDVPAIGTPRSSPVLWCHAKSETQAHALIELSERLRSEVYDLQVLLTGNGSSSASRPDLPWLFPEETLSDLLIKFWSPDVAVFAEMPKPYTVVDHLLMRKAPMFLVDAERPTRRSPLFSRWKSVQRTRLADFEKTFVRSDAAERWFTSVTGDSERMENRGPMRLGVALPPINIETRNALTHALAARPMWLTVDCDVAEATSIARAHKYASRASHRLLLACIPSGKADAKQLQSHFKELGLRTDLQSEKGVPDGESQVFIIDAEPDATLWFHLSPVTYLGGSLTGHAEQNPFYPAALGSAVIHGPKHSELGAFYTALIASDATYPIASDDALKSAVAALIIPNSAAQLAAKASEVTTRGADLMNGLFGHVLTALEDRIRL